jgi:hypothetical protein
MLARTKPQAAASEESYIMTYGMREALVEEYDAEKTALGWTREDGWPVTSEPRDRKALTRASKRVAGLYSEIKDYEAASKEDE